MLPPMNGSRLAAHSSLALLGSASLLWISVCLGCAAQRPDATQQEPVVQHPLMAASQGVERILTLKHQDGSGNFGVDVLRRPRLDEATGEMRDDWLFAMAAGPICYSVLVDDAWNVLAEASWPVTGKSVPWSDVKLWRHRDAAGKERDFVYYCSRGTPLLEITEVTDFPVVHTTTMPIDPGLPVTVFGAHTLQIHAERGVLVLNGVHVEAEPSPPPLTHAAAPALFYDLTKDPLKPERLSMFVGPDAGDQTLFDSQFLKLDGKDIWAPTIAQPLRGAQSYFAFYEFEDAAKMDRASRITFYAAPATGSFHNVVQLLPTPDGRQRLAAGFEAWAFASKPGQAISKCGILDFTDMWKGEMPKHKAWLFDDHNLTHSTHNPAFRMAEHKSHTYDAIPIAHFTGGYYVYECDEDQSSVKRLAHVPVASERTGEGPGKRHPRMAIGEWLRCYNGAWDVVATPIGDLCSSTDREASYLIEPTWGFIRQFGTHIARDGITPRIHLRTGVPTRGEPMRIAVTGVKPGDSVRLLVAAKSNDKPRIDAELGAVWIDEESRVADLAATANGDSIEFELAHTPACAQVWMVAVVENKNGGRALAKSPTATVRIRAAK
ncbi:MAG: hypothetical protein RLZZ562_2752 [Planctomycetota bacterium]